MRRWLPFHIMLAVVIALALLSLQMVFAQSTPTATPVGQTVQIQKTDTLSGLAVRFNKTVACLQRANKLDPTNFSLAGITTLIIPDDCNAVLATNSPSTPTPESAESLTTATFTPVLSGTSVTPASTPPPTGTPSPFIQVGPTPVPDQTYTVVYGDRLAKIADKFGLTVACIASANSISNPDLIYVGQQLRISANCTGGSGGGAVNSSSTTNVSTIANPKACQFDRNSGRIAPNDQYTVQAGDSLDFIACDFNIELQCLKDSNTQLGGVSLLMPGQALTINRSCPVWRDSTLPGSR